MPVHVEALRANRSLRGVSAASLEELAAEAHEVQYDRDERIVPLTNPPRKLGIVLEGLGKLVGVTVQGEERIIYVYHPGEIFGEQFFLEETGIDDYEVLAMHPVRAVVLRIADFLGVCRRHPEVLIGVTRELSRRIDSMNDRLMAAMSDDARVRLSQLLLDFAEGSHPSRDFVSLRVPITHETMSQIIGATRPHTTTTLKALEEEGAVRRQGQKGLLVRPSRLSEIVSQRAYELLREHEEDDAWSWPRPLGRSGTKK